MNNYNKVNGIILTIPSDEEIKLRSVCEITEYELLNTVLLILLQPINLLRPIFLGPELNVQVFFLIIL